MTYFFKPAPEPGEPSAATSFRAELRAADFATPQAEILLAMFSVLTASQQSRILQALGWTECGSSTSSS